jgi:hypothetical protein
MTKLVTAGIGVTVFALACADPTSPHSVLTILSGGGLSDTISSILHPPLTVQLLDNNRQPFAGQTVYFGTGGPVLVAPIDDPGFVINRLPAITDENGQASVWVEFKTSAGPGNVTVSANDQLVKTYYTVLPGAPAYVRAAPRDTVLYVGGSATFRPFITDAHGNRRLDTPTYQYQALNNALSISGPNQATGAAIGRGAVAVTALGFADTVQVSVVPKGRVAVQNGYIVVTDLDGSHFDTIPGSFPGGRSLDWSPSGKTFVMDRNGLAGEIIVSLDTTGVTKPVVTDPLVRGEFYPRYAPDGSYVYFTGNDSVSTCYGVWRIHPDGTALEHVVADTSDCGPYVYQGGPVPDYASSPSPDGTRLVYVGRTLRVHTLATGADTSLGVVGNVPRWSPTGEWIAYDSLGTLMLIRPDGTGHQALLDRGYEMYPSPAAAWSPDGQWLMYHIYDRLALVQVATGLQLPLAITIGWTDPTWQP